VNLYNKAISNKYFLLAQRTGVIASFYFIYEFANAYVFPIEHPLEFIVVILSIVVYIWFIKLAYWDNNSKITEHPIIGTIYSIVGIPTLMAIIPFLMLIFGWMTPFLYEPRDCRSCNSFDEIIIVFVSPIVSISLIALFIFS